jgi:hypothetical protein
VEKQVFHRLESLSEGGLCVNVREYPGKGRADRAAKNNIINLRYQ